MHIYDSPEWLQELDTIVASLPDLEELSGKKVLITGVCGLICSALTDVLLRYNETHDVPIHIVAAARSRERTEERFSAYCHRPYFQYLPYDASRPNCLPSFSVDYIIHGASNASPNKIILEPVETMMSNFDGVLSLLQYAKEYAVSKLLYISSSEVYGNKPHTEAFREDEYGYIDLLNARNSYSVSKRAAETLCVSYGQEYGVYSVIARPGHIYGPTALPSDNRVSSAWAFAVSRGEDIIMKSDGAQLRSYCHCLDCASALILILLKGAPSHAYNISNADSIISIKEMASLLSETAGVKIVHTAPTEGEKRSFNPMVNSSLDSQSLYALGWRGLFDAPTGLSSTVKVIREAYQQ